jgi:microcystin degradation protein MlrC
MGFYYADVAEMGASFLAVADGDPSLARSAAQWMARRAWERRHEFAPRLPSPAEAVRHAAESHRPPVVLMDIGDNVGGGSPGDSTMLFSEVLRQGVPNALVILYAPDAVGDCVAAGVRGTVRITRPIEFSGQVRTLSDGRFTETQVRHGGWTHNDQGITAVVETEQRHTIVLTSRRMPPMRLEPILSLGIHPERKQILIVKGVIAPRAAYAPVAGEIVLVDSPGVTADDPASFEYHRRRRPLYPLEPDAAY